MATGPKKETTNMTVSIMPLKSDGKTLDCDAMFKDICFWLSVKYQILENQPPSLLGALGPEYMNTLCPQHNLSYTLNPGSKFFGLERTSKQWMLRSHQSLDRESGDMSQNHPTVVCSVTRTGFQQDVNMTLNVMVLDEDDSPPVLMSANVTDIYLNNTQLKKGDMVEKDSLIIADQDSSEVNRFYIDVLQDDQKFFRPNCREEKDKKKSKMSPIKDDCGQASLQTTFMLYVILLKKIGA
ncbi:uncharacterized protein [Anabrus simplex]|uniref:uncharacterized protein n=1 Tax=Anabrus simplex TaxID=316456 RepID=UPI0035A3C661